MTISLLISFNMWWCSKDPSDWGGSLGYPQHIFWLTKIWKLIFFITFSNLGAWVDPESFVRGGPDWFCFFSWWGDRGSECHYKWAIIGPPAKHHLNGVSLDGLWWPNIECWLGSFVIFQGIRTSIAKKPYIFHFSGGLRTPCHPLLDLPMHVTVIRELCMLYQLPILSHSSYTI